MEVVFELNGLSLLFSVVFLDLLQFLLELLHLCWWGTSFARSWALRSSCCVQSSHAFGQLFWKLAYRLITFIQVSSKLLYLLLVLLSELSFLIIQINVCLLLSICKLFLKFELYIQQLIDYLCVHLLQWVMWNPIYPINMIWIIWVHFILVTVIFIIVWVLLGSCFFFFSFAWSTFKDLTGWRWWTRAANR